HARPYLVAQVSMLTREINYQLIAHQVYRTRARILRQLRFIFKTDVRLAILIIRIIQNDAEALRELPAELLFYNGYVIFRLLGYIPAQRSACPVIVIHPEVFGVEVLPVKLAVLNPVLPEYLDIALALHCNRQGGGDKACQQLGDKTITRLPDHKNA